MFSPSKPLTEEDVEALVNRVVDKLAERDSPSLQTIKMQVRGPPRAAKSRAGAERALTRCAFVPGLVRRGVRAER